MPLASSRPWFAFAFLLVVLARAATPPAPKPVNDQPVMLSPYEVVANTATFQQWRKLSSPHFILYTDTREKTGIALLRHLEMLRGVAQSFFFRPAIKHSPTIVILPSDESEWKKIATKGTVHWEVAVSGVGTDVQSLITVQYDWETDGFGVLQSSFAKVIAGEMNLSGPLWFAYGLGNFFSTAEFDDHTVLVGRENIRTILLRNGQWIDWPQFFAIDTNSPEYTQKERIDRYAAQTSLFVQYLLTNKDPAWIGRLMRWASLLDAGNPPREADFKAIMGHDWKSWQKTVEDYLRYGEYQTRTYQLPPAIAQCPVRKPDLSTREMRDLFVLTQILNQHIKNSDTALDSILAGGLKTPGLRELLLEACLARHRSAPALTLAQALIADGTANPGVYATAADLLFHEHIPTVTIHARLDADSSQIVAWCRHAIELEPRQVEANRLLAWALALAPEVSPASVKEVRAAYERMNNETSTSSIVAALAVAHWRAGNLKAARSLAGLLQQSPLAYKTDRELATALLAELGPAAPAAPAAPAPAPAPAR